MPTRDRTDLQERTSLHQELEAYQDFSMVVVILLCVYIYKSRIIQNHISPHYKQILKKYLGFLSLHQELEAYQDLSVVVVIFLCGYIYKSCIIQNHIAPITNKL